MLRVFLLILTLLSLSALSFANEVNVDVNLGPEQTFFTYNLHFSEGFDTSSFSFEKPRDAIITRARDNNGNSVRYSIAGDYFIFRPEDPSQKHFTISFVSGAVSEEVRERGVYSNYINFNFPVQRLRYTIFLSSSLPSTIEIFPRNFELTEEGAVEWTFTSIESDTLILVNFENARLENSGLLNLWVFLGISLILIILFLVLFFLIRRIKKNPKIEKTENNNNNNNTHLSENKEKKEEEDFKTIISKYLTQNEGEVVEVVCQQEGISQYDILNYLPHLTKSNLSKIISKLHARKYLNRIRVGKINKIYLGEKLSNFSLKENK